MNTTTRLPEALSYAVASGLDLIPNAVLVLDDHASILYANRAAKEAAQNGRTVTIRNGVVSIASPRHDEVLENVLSCPDAASSPVYLGIPHPPGKPCSVAIFPLPHNENEGTPAALVFLGDPELEREPDTGMLSRMFGFTIAQARVAALLMQGNSVEEVSTALGITEHTARNHLKRLFLKTNTRKQVELVQLLMASPACLRLPANHTNGQNGVKAGPTPSVHAQRRSRVD